MAGMNGRSRDRVASGGASLSLVSFALALTLAYPSSSQARSKLDPVLGERIAEGISFDGRLWLRGLNATQDDSGGGLVSLSLDGRTREVHFERGVLDIERSDDQFWVLRQFPSKVHEFVVSVWRDGSFEDLNRFELSDKDMPVVLIGSGGVPTVLSKRTIHVLDRDNHTWRVIALNGQLRSGMEASAASPIDGGSIYVGFNVGEWGGGLQRVDLHTGAVTNIERRDTKRPCAGPLNSDCDPVTGVIPDMQNKDCVFASVGLVHMGFSHGRILRVCGQIVTIVSALRQQTSRGDNDEWGGEEAFYGLSPAAEGGFWAITWRGLYRFGDGGDMEREYPLPKVKQVSGIYLSRELPGAIVVRTDVNWAVSTSGYTPLVVPLD